MYFGYISVCVAVCSFEFTFDLFVYVLGICVHKHSLVNYHQIVFYLTLCLSACILLAFFPSVIHENSELAYGIVFMVGV